MLFCQVPFLYENDENVILDHDVILTEPQQVCNEEAKFTSRIRRHGGVNRSSNATALDIRKT